MLKTQHCLAVLTLLCLTGGISTVRAQIYTPSNRTPVADSTLGTQVTGSNNNFNITGGLATGQTLFHSFSDFSVPTNGRVDFTNPSGNRDIITRVTGSLFSDINGIVNTNGANFFLINPNGITFGTGAQLNVGQIFLGSTANSLDLASGSGSRITFGTNPNSDAPLLSVAPNVMFDVSRLNLGGGNGTINNFGTIELNSPGQYIGLIGGNVNINGGKIINPNGRIEIGGLSAPGTVILGVEENNRRVQIPSNVPRGNVSLINATVGTIDNIAKPDSSIDIAITAQNLEIFNSSIITNIDLPFRAAESVAGNIALTVSDKTSISNSKILSKTSGSRGGDIDITTGNLSSSDGSAITTVGTVNSAYAGDINIKASGDIIMDRISISNENFPYLAQEQGGNINISARNLSANNSGVSALAKINIAATGNILLDNSTLSVSAPSIAGGTVSAIDIAARDLSLARGSKLSTTANPKFFTDFLGGSININTSGNVSFDNSGAYSQKGYTDGGTGGNININTQNLVLTNNSRLDTSVVTNVFSNNIGIVYQATGGNIEIDARQSVSIDRSGIYSQIGSTSENNNDGAGDLFVKGGRIAIDTKNLAIANGGTLAVSNLKDGSGGKIDLNSNKLELNNGSISSLSKSATGGNINILNTDYLLLNNNSSISTSSGSSTSGGNGGNITIGSPLIIAAPGNNDITANAYQGNGGRIDITSQGLFGIEYRTIGSSFTNDITASSTFGQNGAVTVSTPGIDPGKNNTQLPAVPTDASDRISQACGANNRQNKLTVTGRGGMPPTASDLLTDDAIWYDDRSTTATATANNPTTTAVTLPPPAIGLRLDRNGNATLVAAHTDKQPIGTNVACP